MVSGEVTMRVGGIEVALESIRRAMEREILIGIPAKKTLRPGGPINNASLLFIHTNGSPIRNIPPRPVIQPAIEHNRDSIVNQLRLMLLAAERGDDAAMRRYQARAGLAGQNAARDWFTNPANNWPPNSPVTIARKGSSRPLIDTGNMRNSIIYVLR